MFAEKTLDQRVINVSFDFVLSEIVRNLDVERPFVEAVQDKRPDSNELELYSPSNITYRYHVDLIPSGSNPFYFHRAEQAFSNEFQATDEVISSNVIPKEVKEYCMNNGIYSLGWRYWRNTINLQANEKTILLVPMDEFDYLSKHGKVSDGATGSESLGEQRKIRVAYKYDKQGTPLEYADVWFYAGALGSHVLQYYNKLARFSAYVQHTEIVYDTMR
jgi:hypothetical protein